MAAPAVVASRDIAGPVACLLAAMFVLSLSWFKLSSLDIGYHVAYGRYFLDTGKIVGFEPDPFLVSETAIPFVNANWGSQIIMALAERWAGAAGLTMLRVGLIGVIFGAMAVVVRSGVKSWMAVAFAWVIAALGAYERFSMRPELFSYAIMMVELAILVRGVGSWRGVAALTLLQVLWVNLHSYFLVGLFLAVSFWAEAVWRSNWPAPAIGRENTSGNLRRMTLVLGLTLAACFVHPWGYKAALFPFKTLEFLQSHDVMGGAAGESAKSAWSEISEFQSPLSFVGQRINRWTLYGYFAVLAVATAGLIGSFRRRRVGLVLSIVILLLMSTQMRRNIAQFALAAAPVGAVVLAGWRRGNGKPAVRRAICCILCAGTAAGIFSVVTGRWYFSERRVTREFGTGYNASAFPIDAVNWLASNKGLIEPRLYADYFSSSNTLPWLPDKFKLIVDTNTFAYRDETLQTAFELGLAKIPHGPYFDANGINAVMLHCGPDTQMLVQALIRDGGNWQLVYVDATTVIFLRRIQPHVPALVQFRIDEDHTPPLPWLADVPHPGEQWRHDATFAIRLGTRVNVPMSLGWWKTAILICDEAIRIRPDYDEMWHYRGVAYGNLGNAAARTGRYEEAQQAWVKAAASFKNVLSLRPDHPEAGPYLDRTQQQLTLMPR